LIDLPFFIARVMCEYSYTYAQVLDLPLVLFWTLNRQIDRLRAERDLRQLWIVGSAQSGDASKGLAEQLQSELGRPLILQKRFDPNKFKELASRFKKKG